jgi:drug/metabolite transporter (DMT)-like permease
MDLIILSLISVIFLWSLMFVFYKKLTSQTNYTKLMTLKLLFVAIFSLILVIIVILYDKNNRKEIFNVDKKTIQLVMFTAFIEIITTFLYIYVMYKRDASLLITILESGIIITTVILSILLLKEKICFYRILGILIVLIGIILTYKS